MRLSLPLLALLGWAAQATPPVWVDRLPVEPGRVFTVGASSLRGSEAEARATASARARLELLLSLRARVEGRVHSEQSVQRTHTAGADSQVGTTSTRQWAELSAMAEALPGLSVPAVAFDVERATVYALAELDLTRAGAILRRQKQQLETTASRLTVCPRTTRASARLAGVRETYAYQQALLHWVAQADLLTAAGLSEVPSAPPWIRPLAPAFGISPDQGLTSGRDRALLTRWASELPQDGTQPEVMLQSRVERVLDAILELPRCRLRWSLRAVEASDGSELAAWVFEGLAVGAHPDEAEANAFLHLRPQVQAALDRWLGLNHPLPPSPMENP